MSGQVGPGGGTHTLAGLCGCPSRLPIKHKAILPPPPHPPPPVSAWPVFSKSCLWCLPPLSLSLSASQSLWQTSRPLSLARTVPT